MIPSKKPKLTFVQDSKEPPSASQTTGPTMTDVAALEKEWARDRVHHHVNRKKRRQTSPLRGGDWILNQSGCGATLSFGFEYKGSTLGLTIGHLADLGSPIFCFAEDTKADNPVPLGDGPTITEKTYPMYEIGTVVS